MIFVEGKSVNQTPAIYEESRIIHDSIMVLSGSSETKEQQQLSTSSATENVDSDSEEPGSNMINPQILLQESTTNELQESTSESTIDGATDESTSESTRTSIRPNKDILTSIKFEHENFDKKSGRTHMTKMTRSINPDDEDEPATM